MTERSADRWPARGDVTVEIVARDLCIGCGVCTLACPQDHLRMAAAPDGTRTPSLAGRPCSSACGACLSVCPFWPGNPNEDELGRELFGRCAHEDGIGFYHGLSAASSADPDERISGASGGMGTWIARRCLETEMSDVALLASTGAGGSDEYRICRSPNDITTCAGSRYTPLNIADALGEIARTGETVVITAVPCMAKALRLLCDRMPRYRSTVVAVVGLACGHNKRPDFWRFLAERHGLDGAASRVVSYRVKRPDRTTSDFGIRLEGPLPGGGIRTVTLGLLDDVSSFWSHKWFAMNPCLYCDDLMAECADVALMDAWLPRFESDWRGTTLVVDRSGLVGELMDGAQNAPSVQEIDPREVVLSQAAGLAWKRQGLSQRVEGSDMWGQDASGWKRVPPGRLGRLSQRLRWRLDARIARTTRGLVMPLSREHRRKTSALVAWVYVADKLLAVLRRLGV